MLQEEKMGIIGSLNSKGRDFGTQMNFSEQISDKDALKMYQVDDPSNLYIHQKIQKRVFKKALGNYHEVQAQHLSGKPQYKV